MSPNPYFCLTLLLMHASSVADVIYRDDLPELQAMCAQQREVHIAPLRAEQIEKCVGQRRFDRAGCERHMASYGDRSPGRDIQGLYWHLPICQTSIEAERYFSLNPSREAYELP